MVAGMRMPIPGGTKAGGGIGGLLVIILFVVLTSAWAAAGAPARASTRRARAATPRASSRTASATPTARPAPTPTRTSTAPARRCSSRSSSTGRATLPEQAGTELAPAQTITFSGGVNTGCGQATSQVGPFYCPADQQIYLDTTFFTDVLEGQLGGQGGDFVEPYVLAHEYGHHIQNLLGTMGRVRTQQGPESDAVRLELQADCYAGMWTRDASDGDGILEALDQGDIDEAIDSAKTVGDDRIQQKSGQQIDPEGWTHGSSEQRMRWFMVGYEEGTLEACDTFAASEL